MVRVFMMYVLVSFVCYILRLILNQGGRMAENFERARKVVAEAKELDMMNALDKVSLDDSPIMTDD